MSEPRGSAWLGRVIRLMAVLVLSSVAGCSLADGRVRTVIQPAPTPPSRVSQVFAGVAEADLTPPPGLPTYGYSTNGASAGEGYWTRLKGRIIALQYEDQRVVLIQTDLGAASNLLHRRLAARLYKHGISPANLMVSATHTHGGPGGFFGDKFYNKSVGSIPAFIPGYLDELVRRLEDKTVEAIEAMRPARIGVARADVAEGTIHNRSIEAWRKNYTDQGLAFDDARSVDPTVYLLRVDVQDDAGCHRPAGVWTVFGVHGTSLPAGYPLFHGDVHGLASRMMAQVVRREFQTPGFVAAMATGTEGDVSPGVLGEAQGKRLAMRVAAEYTRAALAAFRSLGSPDQICADVPSMSSTTPIHYAYTEQSMRGAMTSRGKLCDEGSIGAPQAAGSEASRGPLLGFIDMYEGATTEPRTCQATKVRIGGAIQDLAFTPSEYPDVVPFQVIAFGDPKRSPFVLAGFPGEPTTEVGRMVRREIQSKMRHTKWEDLADGSEVERRFEPSVAVVGLANGYATYFTSPSEFMAQHYEGGTTLYGPFQGVFAADKLGEIAYTLTKKTPANAYITRRAFQPGEAKGLWPKGDCEPKTWTAGAVSFSKEDVPFPDEKVTFAWTGMKDDQSCALPSIAVECLPEGTEPDPQKQAPIVDDLGYPVTDEGFDFEVKRCDTDAWTATWTRRTKRPLDGCRFVLRHPERTAPLASARFSSRRSR